MQESNENTNSLNVEEINSLSEVYKEINENINHINNLYDKSNKVKKEIEEKILELRNRKIELSNKTKADYFKIKQYKDEVYNRVTLKRKELEEKIDLLKKVQSDVEKERKELYEERKKLDIEKMQFEKEKQELHNKINRFEQQFSSLTQNEKIFKEDKI